MNEQEIRAAERQARWEIDCVNRGVDRYINSVEQAERKASERGESAVADTKEGMKLSRMILKEYVPAIREFQRQCAAQIADSTAGRKPIHLWLAADTISPEKMAFITVRTVLSRPADASTVLAVEIADRIRTEREFELFKERQNREEREQREAGEDRPSNVYKLMKRYVKDISPRSFKKWAKKAAEVDKLNWSKEEKLALGQHLLGLLCEYGGGCFETRKVPPRFIGRSSRGYATVDVVYRTEKAEELLKEERGMVGINQPWLTPMICKPRPWVMT